MYLPRLFRTLHGLFFPGALAGDSCPLAHGREEVLVFVVSMDGGVMPGTGVLSPRQVQDQTLQWRGALHVPGKRLQNCGNSPF